MTREEASKEIEEEFNEFLKGTGLDNEEYLKSAMETNGDLRKVVEANRMAIKALEQEPCDCISRQAVLNHICGINGLEGFENSNVFEKHYADFIKALPPVTPKPKMGQWITWKEAGNDIPSETRFECSVCHDAAQTLCNGLDLLSPFCPNCGAKMVEQQESED